jgi:sensor histidine kinase YesM
MRQEVIGVIGAVVLGVAATYVAQSIENRTSNGLVLRGVAGVVGANSMARLRTIVSSPLSILSTSVVFLLLGGGLALPSYLDEQRRLIEDAREREVGELQLEKRETDLQLLVLQAQIEPHFLFNTLASLRSLLRQDVDHAEAMIDALVEHLRAAMPVFRKARPQSTLAEQLRICGSYLELMRVRLPDRLTYIIDVPEALHGAPFPPLILLTLVENAIKHGIEPKPNSGHIRIEARREHRPDGVHIRVSVSDDGAGLSAGIGQGVGLSNIRAQLALKYGNRGVLSLTGGAEGGAVAYIDIPGPDANEASVSDEESGA